MLRNVAAVLLGLFFGSLVNMALIVLNMGVLFPAPPDLDMNDPAQMGAYLSGLPAAAFLVVIAAHLGQAFVGGWVAARFGSSRPMLLALLVGALTMLGGVVNLVSLPAPAWMWVEVPLYLLVAAAAGRLETARRAALPAPLPG